jgi:hypothetical protein
MSHYETSPKEKEDEAQRDAYDFDVQEIEDQDVQDRIRRQGDSASEAD